MNMTVGQLVEHRSDVALGQGRVLYTSNAGGVTQFGVQWSSGNAPSQHSIEEIVAIKSLPDRLDEIGPASLVPFQLKVLGRWFEARHALTGELSNQPFQMLPHQVVVTNKVVNSAADGRRWLIADDVGLGKTIEAGMIMEVIRKKTLGRFRCLVVAPAGLLAQWEDELGRRFARRFRRFESKVVNDLETVDQLVASIDTLKLAKFKSAIQTVTPWDLVIFDEAHHLATVPSVQSYQLGEALEANAKARNMLFLTATPHSGNNEHFFNMLRILRADLFPKGAKDYPEVPLKQVMLRNRKSDVTDIHGQKIFKGIAPAKIIHFAPTSEEVAFYEDLQGYLRTGYKVVERLQRDKEGTKATAVGFLMSTFGKLASSSRAAIESALENRHHALQGEALVDPPLEDEDGRFPGEQAVRVVRALAIEPGTGAGKSKKRKSLIEGELAEVEALLTRLRLLKGADSKLAAFIARVREVPSDVKLLIFTEYRGTQDVLVAALRKEFGEGSVATIHGSMKREERGHQVAAFNEQRPNPRFMVSTEAGGEGLNMQKSCHTIVNYDLPWNPMVLQQRIGRVYRYGQQHPVVVINIKVETASEAFADQRVYDYLERKIDEITKKLQEVQDGDVEDLRSEVLGQVAVQVSFDELYKTAVEEGRRKVEAEIDRTADHIERIMGDPKGMLGVFRGLDRFDVTDYEKVAARVTTPQLDFFVRQYLGHQGVTAKTSGDGLLSFKVPKRLIEVSRAPRRADEPTDAYELREQLGEGTIERGTVDKQLAQVTLGCRLLRFGDPAFEAMIRHVQHGGFSDGVASIDLPAGCLGVERGVELTWVLFDLRVVRQEGSRGGARVLRSELASFVVPRGGEPVARDGVVESLNEGVDGPTSIDRSEAARAYAAAWQRADARLAQLYQEVVAESGTREGILPQPVQDVALAWVRAC